METTRTATKRSALAAALIAAGTAGLFGVALGNAGTAAADGIKQQGTSITVSPDKKGYTYTNGGVTHEDSWSTQH